MAYVQNENVCERERTIKETKGEGKGAKTKSLENLRCCLVFFGMTGEAMRNMVGSSHGMVGAFARWFLVVRPPHEHEDGCKHKHCHV